PASNSRGLSRSRAGRRRPARSAGKLPVGSPTAFRADFRVDPLQPRLYSIASSPKLVPGEDHLAVAAVRYEKRARRRLGRASTFLADRVAPGGQVPVFVRPSRGFRLPASDAPVIMIGPGTGIAPFRAFLQERRAIGAPGRNWLFFGNPRRRCDFLFEEELTGY